MWESFSLSMANPIMRLNTSSQECVRAFLSDVPLQFSQVWQEPFLPAIGESL